VENRDPRLDTRTTLVMSHPSERWNYAREIDKQFNHSRFKSTDNSSAAKKFNEEDKKSSLLTKLTKEPEEKKETPAEKLRRKMRQQLNKQSTH